MGFILEQEALIRLSCFFGVLLAMAVWELLAPRRPLTVSKPLRWTSNLGLTLLNTLAVRAIVPLAAVGTALVAQENGWGLFHQFALPNWIEVLLTVVLLDLVIYLQHVMFHAVPVLWRLHMVHHADLDFDVTTGSRFHTIEILLSMGIKMAVVVLLGPPAAGVVIFEVLLNATSMFNHSNVRLPEQLDRILRLLVVTPEMPPRPSLGGAARDQQQLRLQPTLVGPSDGYLSRPTQGRPPWDDDRVGTPPRHQGRAPSLDVGSAVCWPFGQLSCQRKGRLRFPSGRVLWASPPSDQRRPRRIERRRLAATPFTRRRTVDVLPDAATTSYNTSMPLVRSQGMNSIRPGPR